MSCHAQEKDGFYPLTVNSVMTDPHAEVLYAVPHVILVRATALPCHFLAFFWPFFGLFGHVFARQILDSFMVFGQTLYETFFGVLIFYLSYFPRT